MVTLQNFICQSIPKAVLFDNQQVESLPGPASPAPINIAPVLPVSPDVPSAINNQMAPRRYVHQAPINNVTELPTTPNVSSTTSNQMVSVGVPHTSPINNTPGLPIAPNVSSVARHPIASVNTPLPAPMNIAPPWPTASNVSGTVGYQMAPPGPPIVSQQNPALNRSQYMMIPVYQHPTINVLSALPRVMRAVECSVCKTKTLTDDYTYVDCRNPDCQRRICLLDNCFQGFSKSNLRNLGSHQYNKHLKNANPFQCYSCKAPKLRGRTDVEIDTCNVCGIDWCLVGNCTYENPTSGIRIHIGLKHNYD